MNLATELGNLIFLPLLPSRISVFGYDLLQFLVDVEIARPGYSSQVDNCWVEMHYKHLLAVDRLFKDMIILYLINSCTVFDKKNSRIQVDIAAKQGNIYKS